MKILKYSVKTILCLPILIVLLLNWRLYDAPNFVKIGNSTVNKNSWQQLQYLKRVLHEHGAAKEMQQLFPEGFLFTNVLYGLAWADAAVHLDKNSTLFLEAKTEMKWSIAQILSAEGRAIANPNLPLPDGAFYKGWSTYLMGKYLSVLPPQQKDFEIEKIFLSNCKSIDYAILKTEFPYLESYLNAAWPADNMLCLASLNLHDKIYPPQYQTTISMWLNRIQTHLDPKTGLIPHSFRIFKNNLSEGARGSSQSLMLSFLPEIDSFFAKNQLAKFKTHFIECKLGLPAVREYPKAYEGAGDIDSGPVIWNVGASASVVAVRALLANQDGSLHQPIRNAVEAFGFPTVWQGEKTYLGGYLPVAEAFIAWTQAADAQTPKNTEGAWRWVFQLISVVFIGLFGWWIWRL